MIVQLVVAFGLTAATVLIHALGTLEAITHVSRRSRHIIDKPGFLSSEILIVRIVSALLLLHLLEAGVWAGVFLAFEMLPDMETAMYFSLTSYTTVGYGDVVLPASWRILGPVEAGVGILMLGWSTGIIVTALSKIYGGRQELSAGQAKE